MKRKLWTTLALTLALLMIVVTVLPGCNPVTDPEPGLGGETPGAVTLVKSSWSSGNLVFEKKDGTDIMVLDGTNGDVEITLATMGGYAMTFPSSAQTLVGRTTTDTLTNKTLTSPTITNPTITGTISGNATITNPTIATISNNGTITLPADTSDTLVGRATTDTLTNKTLTSPTIGGTPVVANHQTGISSNLSSGSVVVTHGMTGTPTRIFLTFAADPVQTSNLALYTSSINGTAFTISCANTSVSCCVYWLAFIADE